MVSPSPAPASEQNGRTFFTSWQFIAFTIITLAYLATTSTLPFLGRDEPRYVEVAREMWRTGDWITPSLGGAHWFEKPVLLYWMVAASFTVFGVSEWAARLGPSSCGLAIVLLAAWAARVVSPQASRWAGLIMASSAGILVFSFGATFDIVLTSCVALALVAFFLSTEAEQPEQQRRLLALFWAGIGLAFLAKGLVAFILTLGTVGLYALARRRKLKVGLLWGLPLALLVSAVWYGPVTYRNGWTFINEFFVQHHFQRYLSDKYKHSQPPYFYLEILPLLALPWTPVLIAALLRLKKTGLRFDSAEGRLQVFGLCWMLVPLGFFSLSGSKLPDYVLPSLPGIGLLCAPLVTEWARSRKWSTIFAALGFGMLCLRPAFAVWGPGLPSLEEDGVKRLLAKARTSGDGNLALVEYKVTQRTPQFYAAGQLLYDRKENDLMRADSPEELAALAGKQPLLVLVQTKDAADLDSPKLSVMPIGIDSKFTIVRVQAAK